MTCFLLVHLQKHVEDANALASCQTGIGHRGECFFTALLNFVKIKNKKNEFE